MAFLEPVQFAGKAAGKKSAKKATKNKAQLIKVSQVSSEDGNMETTDGGEKEFSHQSPPPANAGKEPTLLQVSKVTSSADERKHQRQVSNGASNGNGKSVKNIYTGFESSKVIKMEKTTQPRLGSVISIVYCSTDACALF